MHAQKSSPLVAIALCLLISVPASTQQRSTSKDSGSNPSCRPDKEWTWKDRDGNTRCRADLGKILEQHKLWSDSDGKSGKRADLNDADLKAADLSGAHLKDANLNSADLEDANLNGADLKDALLYGAHLEHAYLVHADLSYAHLGGAHLNGADLSGAHLKDAYLNSADLEDANLNGADLSGARLYDADLSGARLYDAELANATFEPKNLPITEGIALARDLQSLTYRYNSGPLTRLRKEFQEAGFREQERAITCALNRHDANPKDLRASVAASWKRLRKKDFDERKLMPLKQFVEGVFKWVAFDLTSEYGYSYGRPLRIVAVLWAFFALVYFVFMHFAGGSGIYFVGTRIVRGLPHVQGMQIRPRRVRATKRWKFPFLWLGQQWRLLRTAMFFSLMSAFNIGFRDINFGRWLRLLTKREYDLKALGWARTFSGCQSLLSVYLIALWVLTYFGRPFG